jgi:quercetin dioxygenase-like cupin family protein
MSTGPIVVAPDERPKALDLVGEDITVLASGAQTGSYEIFHQDGREGSGPPPHHHLWDEAFYVLRGDVTFGADGHESTVGPRTFVHIPGGTTHWFRFGEGGGEMLSITSPAGAAAFFTAISRDSTGETPDLGDLVRIAAAHGGTILPPPS